MANILEVIISGQANKLVRAIDQSENKLKSFSGKLKSIGKDLSLRVTAPLTIAGGAAIKLASDFEESLNKVDVAFGDTSKQVRDFSKTTLESFGIASGTALDMAATFGDMSTSMGLSNQTAADLSTSLVGLSGDLASFKNMNIEEVTTALSGVFTGETESLKRLGVVMTEANLKQFALSQGITKNIKDFSQAEKVLLRYQFVMHSTSNAQGDFERTGGGAANQTRKFTEGLKQIGVQLGSILLPTFTKIVTKANKLLTSFSGLSDSTKKLVVAFGLVAAATPPLLFLAGTVLPSIATGLRLISAAAAANPFGVILTGAVALTTALVEVLHKVNPLVDRFTTFVNVLRSGGSVSKFASLQATSVSNNLKEQGETLDNTTTKTAELSTGVQDLTNQLKNLTSASTESGKALAKVSTVSAISLTTKKGEGAGYAKEGAGGDIAVGLQKLDTLAPKAENIGAALKESLNKTSEDIGMTFTDITDTVVDGLAGAIGGLASGSMNMAQAGQALLGVIGGIAVQLGKAALKIGAGMLAIKQSFKNPFTAIAAGVALIAIGAAIQNAGQIPKGGGGGSGSGVQKFANGGIISAPTLGLMGEYSGVKSNPEVVAPLNKLKGMIGQRDSNINVTGGFRLEGQDLVVALQRADRNRNRL